MSDESPPRPGPPGLLGAGLQETGLLGAGLQDAGLQDAGLQDAGLQESGLQVATGRTVARLGRQVEIALARVDLTTAQYRALVQLGEGAEASSSLAAKLAVSRPSVTAVVEGLVQRGLVDRRHSDEDRRRVSVSLTGAGREVLAEADEVVRAKLADLLAVLSPRHADQAVNGITQLGKAMDANKARKQATAGAVKPMTVA